MAIVHLIDRHTIDKNIFSSNMESIYSYVLVSEGANVDPFEISLTIGENYTCQFPAREDQFINIKKEGVLIKPNSSILFSTKETVRLPFNMFGIIFPKGSLFIRYAIVVPTTKIDPGFNDNLYIFVRNEGSSSFLMKPNDVIASVSFFTTDSTPSDLVESRKPSTIGRVPDFWSTWKSKAAWLGEKIWVLLLAVAGGVFVYFLQIFGG